MLQTELDTLNLSKNRVRRIGDGLSHLSTSLRTLMLGHNELATPEDIAPLAALRGLEVLDLQSNRLADGPSVIDILAQLPHLAVLYLQDNPLAAQMQPSYRRMLVARLPQLTYLDDRPVFPSERKACNAWRQAMQQAGADEAGGNAEAAAAAAEAAAYAQHAREEKEKEEAQYAAFGEFMRRARQEATASGMALPPALPSGTAAGNSSSGSSSGHGASSDGAKVEVLEDDEDEDEETSTDSFERSLHASTEAKPKPSVTEATASECRTYQRRAFLPPAVPAELAVASLSTTSSTAAAMTAGQQQLPELEPWDHTAKAFGLLEPDQAEAAEAYAADRAAETQGRIDEGSEAALIDTLAERFTAINNNAADQVGDDRAASAAPASVSPSVVGMVTEQAKPSSAAPSPPPPADFAPPPSHVVLVTEGLAKYPGSDAVRDVQAYPLLSDPSAGGGSALRRASEGESGSAPTSPGQQRDSTDIPDEAARSQLLAAAAMHLCQ